MNGKKWSVANTIVEVIVGVAGLIGIVTSIKSSKYEQEQLYSGLEERYGLTRVDEED